METNYAKLLPDIQNEKELKTSLESFSLKMEMKKELFECLDNTKEDVSKFIIKKQDEIKSYKNKMEKIINSSLENYKKQEERNVRKWFDEKIKDLNYYKNETDYDDFFLIKIEELINHTEYIKDKRKDMDQMLKEIMITNSFYSEKLYAMDIKIINFEKKYTKMEEIFMDKVNRYDSIIEKLEEKLKKYELNLNENILKYGNELKNNEKLNKDIHLLKSNIDVSFNIHNNELENISKNYIEKIKILNINLENKEKNITLLHKNHEEKIDKINKLSHQLKLKNEELNNLLEKNKEEKIKKENEGKINNNFIDELIIKNGELERKVSLLNNTVKELNDNKNKHKMLLEQIPKIEKQVNELMINKNSDENKSKNNYFKKDEEKPNNLKFDLNTELVTDLIKENKKLEEKINKIEVSVEFISKNNENKMKELLINDQNRENQELSAKYDYLSQETLEIKQNLKKIEYNQNIKTNENKNNIDDLKNKLEEINKIIVKNNDKNIMKPLILTGNEEFIKNKIDTDYENLKETLQNKIKENNKIPEEYKSVIKIKRINNNKLSFIITKLDKYIMENEKTKERVYHELKKDIKNLKLYIINRCIIDKSKPIIEDNDELEDDLPRAMTEEEKYNTTLLDKILAKDITEKERDDMISELCDKDPDFEKYYFSLMADSDYEYYSEPEYDSD
jgi:hypothetical protein